MNESEFQVFEAELQKLKPARLPAELKQRLEPLARTGSVRAAALAEQRERSRTASTCDAAEPSRTASCEPCAGGYRGWTPGAWWRALRYLAPLTAAAAFIIAAHYWPGRQPPHPSPRELPAPAALRADHVEIDQQLVNAFDAVTRTPGGAPIRFRCREWVDQVVLRDSKRGVVVEQRTPRLEIVPVSYEMY